MFYCLRRIVLCCNYRTTMLALSVFMMLWLGVEGSYGCPVSCSCKWKGGKQAVECINKSLITIPQQMDPGTQVLEFQGNNLDRLLSERFQKLGLINLQKIFMPRCRIKIIEDNAFMGLTNLVELDLSDNIITTVPTEAFSAIPSLMKLNLNGNEIRILKHAAFQPLGYLNTLDVSSCQIDTIEDGAFYGLNTLECLKLENNKIGYIKGDDILPKHLREIELHNNPWECDCKLVDLWSWLAKYQERVQLEPICNSPSRLQGVQVKQLGLSDLACVPDVSPTALYLEIGEGRNVSLICKVSAIPEAKVSWWFRGNTLQNDSTIAPGLHLYYFVEEGTIEKTSELFIYNTNADDNGTFACVAENPAGKSLSNYTIRIILKEEPIINLTVFPYEYMVIISAALSVFVLLFVICFALCIVQCKRQRRRKRKKDRSKVVTIQGCPGSGQGDKSVGRQSEGVTTLPNRVALPHKINGSVVNKMEHEMTVYATEAGGQGPGTIQFTGPALPPYQEKNPDLISDTAAKEWFREEVPETEWPPRDPFPKHLTADVHLSPSKFIGADGYPLDYGLPKLPGHYSVLVPPASFYRTLPHKTRSAAAGARFSREAEMMPKPTVPKPFEHYAGGEVRYTAEGYPAGYQEPFLSPPGPYKGPAEDKGAQWPECSAPPLAVPLPGLASARSVAAQTGKEPEELPNVLTESPDEGYEGETVDATDI